MRRLLAFVLAASAAAACSDPPPPPPPPPPTQLSIRVVDATNDSAIAGAEVTILQLGQTLVTDASGAILIDPIDPGSYTYRAQAAGYVLEPRARHDLKSTTVEKEKTTMLTIALDPRPNTTAGGTIEGNVTAAGAPVEGALVVATSLRAFVAYSDKAGHYRILGAEAPNLYSVTAFIQGYSSTTVNSVDLAVSDTKTADLTLTAGAGATVGGRLIGGTGTSSVVIAHKETRYTIPGLVAKGTLGGNYSISGVPPGTYEIYSGLEEDGVSFDAESLVDLSGYHLGPTVNVVGTSSESVDLRYAAAILGVAPTDTSTVVAPPTFTWPSVQEANRYLVEVRNVLGQVIYGGFDQQGRPINPIQAPATMLRYDGAQPLARGAFYSWRVYALKPVTTGALFEIVSASEELGGEFRVAR